MKGKLYTGSIDYTELIDLLKTGKYSTFKSEKTGKKYINVSVWINPEPDKYGNDGSIQVNPKKEHRDEGLKRYVGNIKHFKFQQQEVAAEEFSNEDDIPF